jgi:hypothetical protein
MTADHRGNGQQSNCKRRHHCQYAGDDYRHAVEMDDIAARDERRAIRHD